MGVVSAMSNLSTRHRTETEAGYHRSWFPVCLARDLTSDAVIGRDFLGTRVVAYRDSSGKAVVQSAFCPHLGADVSRGQIVDGRLRCPYHHWSFAADGACAHIPTGDKPPGGARLFTYPTAETWGLVWAFNGESADAEPPGMPDADESRLAFETYERGERPWTTWIAVSNGVDFQHLRTVHNLPATSMPEQLEVRSGDIEFSVENPYFLQHGRIFGTSTFAQHLRIGNADSYMLFTGAPIEPGRSNGFFVVGVPKQEQARLPEVKSMVLRLTEEDAPVLNHIRFRRGFLTASDRHLGRYFKYVEDFPCFLPPT